MGPKTGRPVSEGGKKNKLLQVRMDEQSIKLLDDCAQKAQTTRSEVVREGIHLFSKELDAQKK